MKIFPCLILIFLFFQQKKYPGNQLLQEQGILLGACLTCKELVGVNWRVSDCEELVVAIAGDVVNDL